MSNIDVVKQLTEHYSESPKELFVFLVDAPRKYKVYEIPKRTSGTRTIAQPIPKLKEYQRFVISILKDYLPTHECSMAYLSRKRYKAECSNTFEKFLFFENGFYEFF